MKKRKKGFSLLEMIVLIAIVSTIASLVAIKGMSLYRVYRSCQEKVRFDLACAATRSLAVVENTTIRVKLIADGKGTITYKYLDPEKIHLPSKQMEKTFHLDYKNQTIVFHPQGRIDYHLEN